MQHNKENKALGNLAANSLKPKYFKLRANIQYEPIVLWCGISKGTNHLLELIINLALPA